MTPTSAQKTQDMCNRCAFRGAALCRAMAESDRPLTQAPRTRKFNRDQTINPQGQKQRVVGILRCGYLRKERLDAEGTRTLLGLVTPGDYVGLLPEISVPSSLEAATDSEICTFDIQTVNRLMATDGRLRLHLLQQAAEQYSDLLEMIWKRGALTSHERVIAFLLMAAEIMPLEPQPDGSVIITVELSRRDWADLSNTTVESISRTMSQLSEEGLVRKEAAGRYWVRDLGTLARMSGMDPNSDIRRLRETGAPVSCRPVLAPAMPPRRVAEEQ